MQPINYEQLFASSPQALKEALEQVEQQRQVIAEAVKRKAAFQEQYESIVLKIQSAERELAQRRADLVEALGSPNEERVLALISKASTALAEHRERLNALDARRARDQAAAPDDLERKANYLSRAKKKALAQMTGQVLQELSPDTVSVLHRAFSVYTGGLDWEGWLRLVIPTPGGELSRTRFEVAASLGLDLSRSDEE